MAFIEVPEMTVLQGKDAIELLNQMIKGFQQQKGTRLTEKQADALTKTATQIILMISGETQTRKPAQKLHSSGFLSFFGRLRATRLSR